MIHVGQFTLKIEINYLFDTKTILNKINVLNSLSN
jgi:hypothetical protein